MRTTRRLAYRLMWSGLTVAAVLNAPAAGSAQASDGQPQAQYEPSPEYPFGRMNPDAPRELAQFDFMIGRFDCVDRLRQADGSHVEFPATWGAHYFLNGHGVQDDYFSPRFSTSNIRIFDPAVGRWRITFFRMPPYQSGVWEGVEEGDRLVFRNNGQTSGPGLTFYQISGDGFEWHSGGDDPGWTSSCRRQR